MHYLSDDDMDAMEDTSLFDDTIEEEWTELDYRIDEWHRKNPPRNLDEFFFGRDDTPEWAR